MSHMHSQDSHLFEHSVRVLGLQVHYKVNTVKTRSASMQQAKKENRYKL